MFILCRDENLFVLIGRFSPFLIPKGLTCGVLLHYGHFYCYSSTDNYSFVIFHLCDFPCFLTFLPVLIRYIIYTSGIFLFFPNVFLVYDLFFANIFWTFLYKCDTILDFLADWSAWFSCMQLNKIFSTVVMRLFISLLSVSRNSWKHKSLF